LKTSEEIIPCNHLIGKSKDIPSEDLEPICFTESCTSYNYGNMFTNVSNKPRMKYFHPIVLFTRIAAFFSSEEKPKMTYYAFANIRLCFVSSNKLRSEDLPEGFQSYLLKSKQLVCVHIFDNVKYYRNQVTTCKESLQVGSKPYALLISF
jgi:hypothetical protein